jgi:hypothetical protein
MYKDLDYSKITTVTDKNALAKQNRYLMFLTEMHDYIKNLQKFPAGFHYKHGQFPPVNPSDNDIVSVFYDCVKINSHLQNFFQFSANRCAIKFIQDESKAEAPLYNVSIPEATTFLSLKAFITDPNIYNPTTKTNKTKKNVLQPVFDKMIEGDKNEISINIGDMATPNKILFYQIFQNSEISMQKILDARNEQNHTSIKKEFSNYQQALQTNTTWSGIGPLSMFQAQFDYKFSRCILHDYQPEKKKMTSEEINKILQHASADNPSKTELRCMVLQSVVELEKYYSYVKINRIWIVMKPDGAVSVADRHEADTSGNYFLCMQVYTTSTDSRAL